MTGCCFGKQAQTKLSLNVQPWSSVTGIKLPYYIGSTNLSHTRNWWLAKSLRVSKMFNNFIKRFTLTLVKSKKIYFVSKLDNSWIL